MRYLITTILLALPPLSWAEIKFECTGPQTVRLGGSAKTSEVTHTVHLQNERKPFTLRYRGKRLTVDLFGEESEFYSGSNGNVDSPPIEFMSIHRMTLKFKAQSIFEGGMVRFEANCKRAKAFKPKI